MLSMTGSIRAMSHDDDDDDTDPPLCHAPQFFVPANNGAE
jgi:hypothetical protein